MSDATEEFGGGVLAVFAKIKRRIDNICSRKKSKF